MTTTTTTTTTTLMTPAWIRNAVACGVGLLVLVRILATQPAKTFLLTLACLSAGQACVMASSGEKKDDEDEDEDEEEKEKEEEVGRGLLPDKRTEKVNIDKEEDNTNTDLESYEMVEHDLEEKDIVEKNHSATGKKILLKEPTGTNESQMMRSDTMGEVSVSTDGKIADDNKNSRKIIADESPKIIEFVEEYCDNLTDAAVAEVLNEVVSQVVRTGADQE